MQTETNCDAVWKEGTFLHHDSCFVQEDCRDKESIILSFNTRCNGLSCLLNMSLVSKYARDILRFSKHLSRGKREKRLWDVSETKVWNFKAVFFSPFYPKSSGEKIPEKSQSIVFSYFWHICRINVSYIAAVMFMALTSTVYPGQE